MEGSEASNNSNYNRTSKIENIKYALNIVPDAQRASATQKKRLRDCESDSLESNCFPLSDSCSNNKTVMENSDACSYPNLLTRLKGEKWQRFLDYEKILKQFRFIEKTNANTFDLRNQDQNQIQRLSGKEMHYYGLALKERTVETVICNACNGIYTKAGFSTHVIQRHAALWNNMPDITMSHESDNYTNSLVDSEEEHVHEIEDIKLDTSPDSATVNSSINSSPSLAVAAPFCFVNSNNVTKVNRSSGITTSGRSRLKPHKEQLSLISAKTANISSPSSSITSTTPTLTTNLVLPHSKSSKSISGKKSSQGNANNATSGRLLPPAGTFVNVSVKVLPTFGTTCKTPRENFNSAPLIRGPLTSLSNSPISPSSMSSSASTKTSNNTAKSPPSLTYPKIALQLTDASENVTSQMEIVSNSSGYYLDTGAQEAANFLAANSYAGENQSITKNTSEINDINMDTTSSGISPFGVTSRIKTLTNIIGDVVPDTTDQADANNSAFHPHNAVEIQANLSSVPNVDSSDYRFCLLSTSTNLSQNVSRNDINPNQNNMSPPSSSITDIKTSTERKANYKTATAKSELQSLRNEKSKFDDALNKPASSDNIVEPYCRQFEENLYYQQHSNNQNSYNENSELALDSTFEHDSKSDERQTKFITESVYDSQKSSDNNFEDLEDTSYQLHLQPSAKRLRLDVSTSSQKMQDSFYSLDEQHQQQNVLLRPNTNIKLINNANDEYALPQENQLLGFAAMKAQPTAYHQITGYNCLGGLDEGRSNQITIDCVNNSNSKENTSLSKENVILENDTAAFILRRIFTETETNIDHENHNVMEWKFKISNALSLTDECSGEEQSLEMPLGLRENDYGLPAEDCKLLSLDTQSNHNLINHINQQHLTNHIQSVPKTIDNSCIGIKSLDSKYPSGIPKENCILYDFTRLDTSHFLNLSINVQKRSRAGHKQLCNDFTLSGNVFNSIPRPFTINNFAVIKFPLTRATVFRKIATHTRKANNNEIIFGNITNTFVGLGGYIFSGSSTNPRYSSV